MKCSPDRTSTAKKSSLERRVSLYRESSCIEEYCVKRDLQLPSFKWKLFDIVAFCSKHQALIQTVWNNDTAFPFVGAGSLVSCIFTVMCKCVFGCDDLLFVFIISMSVFSFLALMFFIMMCNVCFELRILQIRKSK